LVRVLGNSTVEDFDPFLMLDTFDSKNPADYVKGFPWHPPRGIEKITHLIHGDIEHRNWDEPWPRLMLGDQVIFSPARLQRYRLH